ncbi:MAG: hydrogenase maturation nickel metallochaperone HypA [Spirochaetia bacterium]|nr:hydrogenase maturation nickel metallochaperone HypA [Spirochaetia bacterium]MCF7941504.1 hydrogenase maturation nickel metallochaperone HypA [Spirochaetia bacterium]
MHELGVVIEVIKTVEQLMKEHQLTEVATIVLQIGELSSMIPRFVQDCYPAAVDGTLLEKTTLEIEILTTNALCQGCGKVYPVVAHQGVCPHCGSTRRELLGGREFLIKEIIAC